MSRSWCSYDQDSDTFAVTVKLPDVRGERFRTVTNYLCPGSFIRRRFDYHAPLNGESLSNAIQAYVIANKQ